MKKIRNFIILVSVNIIILFSIVIIIELFLGDWTKSKPNVSKVPAAIWNKSIKYDVSKLYGLEKKFYINYSRDKKGYRGLEGQTSKLQILTIGGSTTDQRYVSDSYIWQKFLNKKLPNNINVINAGVDGQSTYGHIFSIKHWHSPDLTTYKIPLIIFFFGANDGRLLNHGIQGLSGYDILYEKKKLLQKIRIFLSRNSFLYAKLKNITNKIINLTNRKQGEFLWHSHYNLKESFIEPGIFYNIPDPQNKIGYNYYVQLIKDLVLETRKSFPNSKILFVQQQIVFCRFVNEKSVWDRHPVSGKKFNQENNYCNDLGQIFIAQDQAISEMKLSNQPHVVKLYLQNVISDDGTYDVIHTNKKGSQQIGEWLAPIVKKILQIH